MAVGDISLIDTEDIDNLCHFPDLIRISDTLYASCFGGGDSNGWLKTFTISAAGAISAFIGSKEWDTSYGETPSIAHVSGDVYAIAYSGPGTDGFLKTLEIDSDGNISNIIDTWEFDLYTCRNPHIIKIYGTIFAIGYLDSHNRGRLITVSISSAGAITKYRISYADFDTTYGRLCRIIHVYDNVYAIAYTRYTGSAYQTGVKTITITPDGAIGSVIDSLFWSSYIHGYPEIIRVTGSIYAIAYADGNNMGQLVTLDIQPNGAIGNAVIDTWGFSNIPEYTSTIANRVGLMMSSYDVIAVAFKDVTTNDGWLVTATIDAQGNISERADAYEFETYDCDNPRILKISEELIVINFKGTSAHNLVKTLGVESAGGTIYPTDSATSLTRVSGLVHRWSPGNYTLEMFLGDTRTLWDVPPITRGAKTTRPEEDEYREWRYPAPFPREPEDIYREWLLPKPFPREPAEDVYREWLLHKPPPSPTYIVPSFPGVAVSPKVYEDIFGVPPKREKVSLWEGLRRAVRASTPIGVVRKAVETWWPW